jgi:hypothetical protein
VLSTLYHSMGENPQTVDLNSLWKELGVGVENGVLRLDDKAPLANIREGITSPTLRPAVR